MRSQDQQPLDKKTAPAAAAPIIVTKIITKPPPSLALPVPTEGGCKVPAPASPGLVAVAIGAPDGGIVVVAAGVDVRVAVRVAVFTVPPVIGVEVAH